MDIITNNQPRDLISVMDLSESERADFDYLEVDERYSRRVFRYRGGCYDAGDMMPAPDSMPGWDGYQGETFFSGVLVRFADVYGESVIVGRYYP